MRLSEVYASVQGEGPRVGLPTAFVRFAGCNLRCPLWPCDSPYAIDPKQYRKEWEEATFEEVYTRVEALPVSNVCLTGGEPWLQPKEELRELILVLLDHGYTVECFTNGTLPIPDWAFWKTFQIHFVFDWKLPGSGETEFNAEIFENNVHRAAEYRRAVIKFTVADMDDLEIALERSRRFPDVPVYVGPVWGAINSATIVGWMLSNKLKHWRLNTQVHKYIFDPKARGI